MKRHVIGNCKSNSTLETLNGLRGGRGAACIAILSLMIVVLMMVIGSFKVGYHVDEILTMGLSNHQYSGSIYAEIKDGIKYSGQQLWQEYTTVSDSNRFDYGNVIENQTHDVHPPLYYAVIHTIFSLFPNTYSMRFALIANIGFAVVVFWQVTWMFHFFIKQQKMSILFSMLYIFTMGFVNNVVFFRMYVLLELWTNALIILFCKYRPEDNRWQYYAFLVFILFGGIMTQYYFIIFAFFSCIVYAIRVVQKRNWKKIVLSCFSVALSVGISSFVFPAMWMHIFSGSRGKEAFDNLSANGLWKALWSYLDIINLRVFGGLFVLCIFLATILYIVNSKNIDQKYPTIKVSDYLQLAIPVIGYIVMISKIAPFRTDRYVMNIMGIAYILCFAVLICLTYYYSRQAIAGIMGIALLVLFCSYKEGIPYLYRSESENVALVNDLDTDIPCLYFYDNTWKIFSNYVEMANLDEIIFIKNNNLELLDDDTYKNYDSLLLYVIPTADTDNIINQLLDQNPELSSSRQLFKQGYATAYYLE